MAQLSADRLSDLADEARRNPLLVVPQDDPYGLLLGAMRSMVLRDILLITYSLSVDQAESWGKPGRFVLSMQTDELRARTLRYIEAVQNSAWWDGCSTLELVGAWGGAHALSRSTYDASGRAVDVPLLENRLAAELRSRHRQVFPTAAKPLTADALVPLLPELAAAQLAAPDARAALAEAQSRYAFDWAYWSVEVPEANRRLVTIGRADVLAPQRLFAAIAWDRPRALEVRARAGKALQRIHPDLSRAGVHPPVTAEDVSALLWHVTGMGGEAVTAATDRRVNGVLPKPLGARVRDILDRRVQRPDHKRK